MSDADCLAMNMNNYCAAGLEDNKTGNVHWHTTHTHTHKPHPELYMQPHLPTFYHNNTLLYCILSFNNL